MILKTLATATCLALAAGTAAKASTVDFNFSFGGAAGTIFGLTAGTTSSASSVEFNIPARTNTLVFDGIGDTISANSFEVSADGSSIIAVVFAAKDNGSGEDFLSLSASGVSFFQDDSPNSYFEGTADFVAIAAVPLPAGLPLMLAGFAGIGVVARRQRAK